jgi:hypothetical protein
MEVENILNNEITREFLKSRDNITLVIKYLNELKNNPAKVEVNNDCVRMLMESLKIQSDIYLQFNELPINNAELQLQNYILRVQKEKLEKDLKEALK